MARKKKNMKDILLRAAYDLIKRNDGLYYVESAAETKVNYNGADMRGENLMEDIALELGIDEDTEPLPLEGEDDA